MIEDTKLSHITINWNDHEERRNSHIPVEELIGFTAMNNELIRLTKLKRKMVGEIRGLQQEATNQRETSGHESFALMHRLQRVKENYKPLCQRLTKLRSRIRDRNERIALDFYNLVGKLQPIYNERGEVLVSTEQLFVIMTRHGLGNKIDKYQREYDRDHQTEMRNPAIPLLGNAYGADVLAVLPQESSKTYLPQGLPDWVMIRILDINSDYASFLNDNPDIQQGTLLKVLAQVVQEGCY